MWQSVTTCTPLWRNQRFWRVTRSVAEVQESRMRTRPSQTRWNCACSRRAEMKRDPTKISTMWSDMTVSWVFSPLFLYFILLFFLWGGCETFYSFLWFGGQNWNMSFSSIQMIVWTHWYNFDLVVPSFQSFGISINPNKIFKILEILKRYQNISKEKREIKLSYPFKYELDDI